MSQVGLDSFGRGVVLSLWWRRDMVESLWGFNNLGCWYY